MHRAAYPCLLPTTMSTMESPTALINALYSFSFTTSLLASNLSTATPTDQTCVAAAAEFKKEADKAHALFRIAIQSGRDAAQDVKEEQEDEEEQKPKEIQGDKGEGEGEAGMFVTHNIRSHAHLSHRRAAQTQARFLVGAGVQGR